MARNLGIALAAVLLLGLAAVNLRGQDTLLSELYGRGVHAYFQGNYQEAHSLLAESIELGTRDPRVYYYRGLIYAQTGRPTEAAEDFETGARLEATNDERIYPVGRSLQRIQGPLRLELEQHRREARLEAKLREQREQRARYEQLREREADVLMAPEPPVVDVQELPAEADPTDPFAEGAAPPAQAEVTPAEPMPAEQPPQEAEPAAPQEPALDDPFGEQPAEAPDPFSQPGAPQQPAEQMPDDIFAPAPDGAEEALPAEADPFGQTPAAPAGEEPANPFGASGVDPTDLFGPAAENPAAPAGEDAARGERRGGGGAFGALFRALTGALPDAPDLGGPGELGPDLLPADNGGLFGSGDEATEPDMPADPFSQPGGEANPFGPAEGQAADDAAAEPAAPELTPAAPQQPGPATEDPFGADPFGADPFGADEADEPESEQQD